MGTESSESTGGEGTVRDLAESVTLAQQFDATNEDVRNEVHTLQSSLAQPHLYRESNTRAALKDPSTSSHGEQLQHFIDGLCTKLSQPQASKDSTISHLPDHYKEHNGRQTSPAAGAEQSVQQEQTEQTNVGGEHKLSDNETSDGGYEDISRMLREAGFEGMRSNSESELKHKLAHVLQHARKKQDAIDRARSEAAEERNRASRLAKEADRLEQERAKLEREAGKKELQRESAAEASTSELNKAKEDARRARQAESSAQQQLSQLQHQYKAKERELQQLQDKLQAKADAEDRRAHRDREALQQMQQELQAERRSGNPKHAASSFSQGEIVSAYESLREQLNTQLEELRAENERLHQKVRNTSLPRGSGATLGLEVEASSVDDAEQAVEPSDTSHADGQERQRGNEVGSLQLGQEQQQQSKRSPHSPRASLRGQVKRDKKDFRLQLHLLDHLSHATLVEHVRTACRRLDLSEPARIGAQHSVLVCSIVFFSQEGNIKTSMVSFEFPFVQVSRYLSCKSLLGWYQSLKGLSRISAVHCKAQVDRKWTRDQQQQKCMH